MSFEEKLKRIEEIVKLLEGESCGFEESVKLYEEASLLIKDCYNVISGCSGKVKEINEELKVVDYGTD